MADLAAFPFLAPHSLRRPPVVAGLVPNPMSWGGVGGWGECGGEGSHSLGTGVSHHRSNMDWAAACVPVIYTGGADGQGLSQGGGARAQPLTTLSAVV